MEDVRRILVASRSTAECKSAFHYGVALARALVAEVSILHIEYDPFEKIGFRYLGSLGPFQQEYLVRRKEIREEIEGLVRDEETAGMAIRQMIREGEPVGETVRAVIENNIDLLVMAAHEEGRIERMIYGRSNHEIVRRLPCSILFVKDSKGGAE
ncbi:MAG TPA: universal stress protein [Syntrophorhabdaceae bacterium]|nr:universal stress protein [Syntrophorhabdaceae bacterium]